MVWHRISFQLDCWTAPSIIRGFGFERVFKPGYNFR